MRDEIAQLAKALEPSFTAPEDAELAATMMVMSLRDELGQSATEADQLRYRAALERLPNPMRATVDVIIEFPEMYKLIDRTGVGVPSRRMA